MQLNLTFKEWKETRKILGDTMTGCGTECLTITPSTIYIERKEYLCINIGNSMADWDEDMDKITPNG